MAALVGTSPSRTNIEVEIQKSLAIQTYFFKSKMYFFLKEKLRKDNTLSSFDQKLCRNCWACSVGSASVSQLNCVAEAEFVQQNNNKLKKTTLKKLKIESTQKNKQPENKSSFVNKISI